MSKFGMVVYHNIDCLKCNALELEMVKIGTLVMCNKCTEEEFKTDDPVQKEYGKYKKWLEVHKEKYY